jgi:hypothetical protein
LATPNYGYEKRQKELAKKRKKEDKLKARADRKTGSSDDDNAASDGQPDDVQAPAPTPGSAASTPNGS